MWARLSVEKEAFGLDYCAGESGSSWPGVWIGQMFPLYPLEFGSVSGGRGAQILCAFC